MIEDEGVGGIRAELPDDEEVTRCCDSKGDGQNSHFNITEQEAGDQREDAEDDERGENTDDILPLLHRLVAMTEEHARFPVGPEADALPAVRGIMGEDEAVDEFRGRQYLQRG